MLSLKLRISHRGVVEVRVMVAQLPQIFMVMDFTSILLGLVIMSFRDIQQVRIGRLILRLKSTITKAHIGTILTTIPLLISRCMEACLVPCR